MATMSSGILGDGNLLNLKPIAVSQVRSQVTDFLYLVKRQSSASRRFVIRLSLPTNVYSLSMFRGLPGKRSLISHIPTPKCSILELKLLAYWISTMNWCWYSMTETAFNLTLRPKWTLSRSAPSFRLLFCNDVKTAWIRQERPRRMAGVRKTVLAK